MVLNRRGFTGFADAMFFILLTGLAAAMISGTVYQEGHVQDDDASEICDELFKSKMTADEFGMELGSGRVYHIVDLTAASVASGDGAAEAYFGKILGSMYERPGSYLMTLTFGGNSVSVGTGSGTSVSGFSGDYTSRYGTVHAELTLY